jgi:hypothetical protein
MAGVVCITFTRKVAGFTKANTNPCYAVWFEDQRIIQLKNLWQAEIF